MQPIPEQTLLQIDHYFHELIRTRAGNLIDSLCIAVCCYNRSKFKNISYDSHSQTTRKNDH
jgi:hypothetical protein